MARTGATYLDSLIDERAVFLDGERVEKITTHPAFQQAARSIAALYDFHSAAENLQNGHKKIIKYLLISQFYIHV